MIQRIAIQVAVLAVLAAGLWWQAGVITDLRQNNAALTLALDSAKAKQTNITEDTQSDAEIDNIPDDGLRTVPDRWLQRDPGDGGLY